MNRPHYLVSSLVWLGRFLVFFLSIPSVFSVSELFRLFVAAWDTFLSLCPPKGCRYSSEVQLSILYFSGEVAFKPQPTLSILLWGEIWLPGNYSWSNYRISVLRNSGFSFFFFSFELKQRLQNSLQNHQEVVSWSFHCNIIQMLNLESGRRYKG